MRQTSQSYTIMRDFVYVFCCCCHVFFVVVFTAVFVVFCPFFCCRLFCCGALFYLCWVLHFRSTNCSHAMCAAHTLHYCVILSHDYILPDLQKTKKCYLFCLLSAAQSGILNRTISRVLKNEKPDKKVHMEAENSHWFFYFLCTVISQKQRIVL